MHITKRFRLKSDAGIERLLNFAFILIIFVHLLSCSLYLVPKLEGLGPNTWVFHYGYNDKSSFEVIL